MPRAGSVISSTQTTEFSTTGRKSIEKII
jgi:hypothetical protein